MSIGFHSTIDALAKALRAPTFMAQLTPQPLLALPAAPDFAAETSVTVLLEAADKLVALRNAPAALKAYERALEMDSNNTTAWVLRGFALASIGRYDEAIESYDQALTVNPTDGRARQNKEILLLTLIRDALARGNGLFKQEKYREALEAYERALTLDPNNVDAWAGEGEVLRKMGRVGDADKAFERAQELGWNPDPWMPS